MVTIEEVVSAYYTIVPIIINCKTVEQIKDLTTWLDIELNYDAVKPSELTNMSEIETIRIDNFKCLDYIFFNDFQSGNPTIWFDVWDSEKIEDIIENTNIQNVSNELKEYYAKHNYEVKFHFRPLTLNIAAKDENEARRRFDEWFENVDKSVLKEMFVQSITDNFEATITDIIDKEALIYE